MTASVDETGPWISARAMLVRFDITNRTLRRWYTPDEAGYCGLPAPVYLGDRLRYWRRGEVEAWEAEQVARVDRPKPPLAVVAEARP